MKKKKKIHKFTITLFILDILAFACLFLAYGPFAWFKNFLVTTAMTTMNHHYLARTIYTDKMIADVLNHNYIKEFEDNTNTDDINFNNEDNGNYESIYEEQILKRDPGNDLYKVIELDENGYHGYLVVVYDASNVELVMAANAAGGGQQLPNIAKDNDAKVAINASGLYYPYANKYGVKATGTVIKDGKIYSVGGGTGWGGGLIGFTYDNVLVLTNENANTAIANGMRDAVDFGPFLIVNGVPATIEGNGGYGIAPRTAIAQRKDGIVLFLVIDGRSTSSLGIDVSSMIDIFMRYKAHNAANLDGGGSSTLVVNGEVINNPKGYGYEGGRYLVNAWAVIDKKENIENNDVLNIEEELDENDEENI